MDYECRLGLHDVGKENENAMFILPVMGKDGFALFKENQPRLIGVIFREVHLHRNDVKSDTCPHCNVNARVANFMHFPSPIVEHLNKR